MKELFFAYILSALFGRKLIKINLDILNLKFKIKASFFSILNNFDISNLLKNLPEILNLFIQVFELLQFVLY